MLVNKAISFIIIQLFFFSIFHNDAHSLAPDLYSNTTIAFAKVDIEQVQFGSSKGMPKNRTKFFSSIKRSTSQVRESAQKFLNEHKRAKSLGLLQAGIIFALTALIFAVIFLFKTAPVYYFLVFLIILVPFLIKKPQSFYKYYSIFLALAGCVTMICSFLLSMQFLLFLGIGLLSITVIFVLSKKKNNHYQKAASQIYTNKGLEIIQKQTLFEQDIATVPENGAYTGIQKILEGLLVGFLFFVMPVMPLVTIIVAVSFLSLFIFFQKKSKQYLSSFIIFSGAILIIASFFFNSYIVLIYAGILLFVLGSYSFISERMKRNLLVDKFKTLEDKYIDAVFDKEERLPTTFSRRMELFHLDVCRLMCETLFLVAVVVYGGLFPGAIVFFLLGILAVFFILTLCNVFSKKILYLIPLILGVLLLFGSTFTVFSIYLNLGIPFLQSVLLSKSLPFLGIIVISMTGIFYFSLDKDSFLKVFTNTNKDDSFLSGIKKKSKVGLKTSGEASQNSKWLFATKSIVYSLLVGVFLSVFFLNPFLTSVVILSLLGILIINFFVERYTNLVYQGTVILSLIFGFGFIASAFLFSYPVYMFLGIGILCFGATMMLYKYQNGGRTILARGKTNHQSIADGIHGTISNSVTRFFRLSSGIGQALLLFAEAIFVVLAYVLFYYTLQQSFPIGIYLAIFALVIVVILFVNVLLFDGSINKEKAQENLSNLDHNDIKDNDSANVEIDVDQNEMSEAKEVWGNDIFDDNNHVIHLLWAADTARLQSNDVSSVPIYKFTPVIDGKMLHWPEEIGSSEKEIYRSVAEVYSMAEVQEAIKLNEENAGHPLSLQEKASIVNAILKELAFKEKKHLFLIGSLEEYLEHRQEKPEKIEEIKLLLQNRKKHYENLNNEQESLKFKLVQMDSYNGVKAPLMNAFFMIQHMKEASDNGLEIIFFPESSLSGFNIKDLFDSENFIEEVEKAKNLVIKASDKLGIAVGLGLPTKNKNLTEIGGGKAHRNSYLMHFPADSPLNQEETPLDLIQNKVLLPTYKEQEEYRWYEPGKVSDIKNIQLKGHFMGLHICEDGWNSGVLPRKERIYENDPVQKNIENKASFLMNISASPYYQNKFKNVTYDLFSKISAYYEMRFLYLDVAGEQSGMMFGGHSFVMNSKGEPVHLSSFFTEDSKVVDIKEINDLSVHEMKDDPRFELTDNPENDAKELKNLLVAFLKAYVRKHNLNLKNHIHFDTDLGQLFKDIGFYEEMKGFIDNVNLRSKNQESALVFIYDGSPESVLIAKLCKESFNKDDVKIYAICKQGVSVDKLDEMGITIFEDSFESFNLNSFNLNKNSAIMLSNQNLTDFMLGNITTDHADVPFLYSLTSSDVLNLLEHWGDDDLNQEYQGKWTEEERLWNVMRDTILTILVQEKQRDFKSVIERSYPLFLQHISLLKSKYDSGQFLDREEWHGLFSGQDSIDSLYLSFLKTIVREVEVASSSHMKRRDIPMFTPYSPTRFLVHNDVLHEDPDKSIDKYWIEYKYKDTHQAPYKSHVLHSISSDIENFLKKESETQNLTLKIPKQQISTALSQLLEDAVAKDDQSEALIKKDKDDDFEIIFDKVFLERMSFQLNFFSEKTDLLYQSNREGASVQLFLHKKMCYDFDHSLRTIVVEHYLQYLLEYFLEQKVPGFDEKTLFHNGEISLNDLRVLKSCCRSKTILFDSIDSHKLMSEDILVAGEYQLGQSA